MEPEGTIVYTDHQRQGKGQRGNVWIDEPGKNILMSVLLRPDWLSVADQYYFNIIAGLAVMEMLDQYSSLEKKLKWPNDIYLNGKKVCGILIENNLKGMAMESSIVGIGFNLNQKRFNMFIATSLFMETNEEYNRDEVIEDLLLSLERWYLVLKEGKKTRIMEAYHRQLMWRDEMHEFEDKENLFQGVIRGIDCHGKLVIERENGKKQSFHTKEIRFIQ